MYTVGRSAVLHLEVELIGIPRSRFLLENLQSEGTLITLLGQDNLTMEMKERSAWSADAMWAFAKFMCCSDAVHESLANLHRF